MEKEQNVNKENDLLTSEEMDAIGEVMNISMGASATAISAMLDKQVVITTPKLSLMEVGNLDYSNLEPAVLVKIRFVQSILGTNVMLFRRHDMQIILNLLMGNEDMTEDEDFEFDELSMSAACEVMNQMMGSAATALSEILQEPVNISTPEACIMDENHPFSSEYGNVDSGSSVVSISFDLSINGVMNTNFVSVIPIELASSIVNKLMGETTPAEEEPAPQPEPPAAPQVMPEPPAAVQEPAAAQPPTMPPAPPAVPAAPAATPAPPPQMEQPPMAPPPQPQQQQAPVPPYPQQAPVQMPYPGMPQQYPGMPAMGQQPYPMQPPMYAPQSQPYQPMPQQNAPYPMPPQQQLPDASSSLLKSPTVGVKKAQFPDFSEQDAIAHTLNSTNMGLLMNVPLDVSVEIGKTKRKIKEIAEFGQGTVIELEKQAGAPVDIIVNGQLLAHGDVVVIGDNFGVRITAIVGTKELIDSLDNLT